jgi:hypothetical protein
MSALVWNPVYCVLEEKLKAGDKLILLVVPFIKIEAIKQLLWAAETSTFLKVVVRWRPGDLIAGVTDLEIYPFLKAKNIPLYYHRDIHLKLYAFESNTAFNTSGNLTLSGLGYSDKGNIEVGSIVDLAAEDWRQLFGIIEGSTQVDDDVYAAFQNALSLSPGPSEKLASFAWPEFPRKLFTIQSLPATESPNGFLAEYLGSTSGNLTPEEYRRFAHDLAIYQIPSGLTEPALSQSLVAAVQRQPFIASFVNELKINGSMRFGAVTEWIHSNCEDVPVPYRWEVKDSVRILFNWLQFAYPEITWDTPRYAQVIYWKHS